MLRELKIKNLIKDDWLYIAGMDWVSNAMGLDKYENQLVLIQVEDSTKFEFHLDIDEDDRNVMIRVRQTLYMPIQLMINLEKYNTTIVLNRVSDPIY